MAESPRMNPFVQKVLDVMIHDPALQKEWLIHHDLAPASQSQEMQKLVQRVNQAFESDEKVLIAGDYDCDGMMATAILVDGLKSMDIQTGFYIPNRIKEGYGLSEKTVKMAHEKGYSLIITVDNGVKSQEALIMAKKLGVDVIISDHHQYDQRPECLALVHPHTLEVSFSTLCGAGIAYEILRALKADQPRHLQWAAIASLADCVPVSHQTRAIIQQGMESMKADLDPHLRLLAGKDQFSQEDISFQIVPRINTIGRLADEANANNFVRFLLNSNPRQMTLFCNRVEELNARRKEMSRSHMFMAQAKIRPYYPILISAEENYHPGIIGIAAGQLCESLQKPVILASVQEGICKASMRAPAGFHCVEFLKEFDHFLSFGGHDQAAGFSVDQVHWDAFTDYCLQKSRSYSWNKPEEKTLEIKEEEITLENLEALEILRPFGPGFEMPKLLLSFPEVRNVYDLCEGKHRRYTLKSGIQCLNFNQSQQDLNRKQETIARLSGSLQLNEYRSRKSVNFIIREIEYAGEDHGPY